MNSILWGDKQGNTQSEIEDSGGAVTVTYSDIEGGHTGVGNISSNHLFMDATSGILALRPTSPCIDHGTTSGTVLANKDLDGNPRVLDGDGNGVAVVDIGAYEYQPSIMALVKDYYLDFLGRPSDEAGADWWAVQIEFVFGHGVGINEGFLAMAKSFFNAPEYLSKGNSDEEFVTDLYRSFFQREPDDAGFAFWTGMLDQGLTHNGVMYNFAYSSEFEQFLEARLGNVSARPENNLVNDFYRGLLGRFPDGDGHVFRLDQMRNAQCTGAQQVRDISHQIALLYIQSQEYANRNRNSSQFVEDLYDAVMRRGPDSMGFALWEDQLVSGSMTRQALMDAIVNSGEFQLRAQNVIDAGCMQ